MNDLTAPSTLLQRVRAYLLKDRVGDVDELIRAVVSVSRGGLVINPLVIEGLLARP